MFFVWHRDVSTSKFTLNKFHNFMNKLQATVTFNSILASKLTAAISSLVFERLILALSKKPLRSVNMIFSEVRLSCRQVWNLCQFLSVIMKILSEICSCEMSSKRNRFIVTLTSPCSQHALKPHYCIGKRRDCKGIHISHFFFFLQTYIFWVLVRIASVGQFWKAPTSMVGP